MTNADPTVVDSTWTAGGAADDFRSLQLRREYRRSLRRICIAIALTMAVVGIPGWIGWARYQDARRQTLVEEFDSRRPALQDLASRGNPAVKSLLQTADELRSRASDGTVAESVAALRQGLVKLADAASADRDLLRLRPVLTPIGNALNETPWLNSSALIEQRVKSLNRRHVEVTELLERGEIRAAEQALAKLLSEVGTLQRDNVEAMRTATSRLGWQRLQASLPERLANEPGWTAIVDIVRDAESGWNQGDWVNSRNLYTRADERAQKYLQTHLTAEERSRLIEADAGEIARLETERADLKDQIKQLQGEKSGLVDQLATTNSQRLAAEMTVTTLSTEIEKVTKTMTAATSELNDLRPLPKQVADKTSRLKAAEVRVAELTKAREEIEDKYNRSQRQLTAKTAEIESLKAATGGAGGGESVVIQVSATLAGIESQLTELAANRDAPAAANSARDQLAEALQQYDRLVQEKETALAQKYLPTSQKVTALDRTIQQAELTLAGCLKALDRPLAEQFDALQGIIATAESDYQTLLKEVLPDHVDAIKLKQRITALQQQQQTLTAAKSRHSGKSTISSKELASLSRHQVEELIRQRQMAEFERLRREGKVPTAAGLEMVPIQPGNFARAGREISISKPFFAGKYEVTVAQILRWLNSPGVTFDSGWIDLSDSNCPIRKTGSRFELNSTTEFGKSEKQPMQNISWHGAVAFCEWCTKQDPRFKYRLPTEAEWEYIARAGSTTDFPWGASCNGAEANVNGDYPHGTSSKGPYLKTTTQVGSYKPNAWGLYDTVGNCWEWCHDVYDTDYVFSGPLVDPPGPSGSGSSRVCRGGSWGNYAIDATSSYRYYSAPDRRGSLIGFRVVSE